VVELGGRPHDVKPFPGGIVVANEGANRIELLTATGERGATVALPSPPHDVAVSPDGRTAWATLDGSDDLVVVDLGARAIARTVSTDRRPHDLLFSLDGRLWVTDWAGAVHVFSPDGKLIASQPLGEEAHHLAFSPSGDRAWIADHGAQELFVLDTRSVQVVQRISLPGSPHHLAVTPDGELVAVADHDNGMLLVLRAQSGEEVGRIAVGAQPHGVWPVAATQQTS
jgi:DNA-binding beta-propeller fold protein YncE